MAPEQARGDVEQVDQRVDVFALGAILCEVLTGGAAFTGRSLGEIQRKADCGDLTDAFNRLDVCAADCELIALAKDCLAPRRDDRPRDASVFVERLAGYLASIEQRLRAAELERAAESARAKEAQARAAVERSRRRRTVALAASLLALTILGGLTFTYLLQQRQARFAAADRILAEVTTLLAQARTEPEEPARWQAVLTASRRIDGLALSEGARARLDILTAQANTGATTAGADQELLSKLIDFRLAQIDSIYGFAAEAAYADAFRAAAYDIEAQGPEAVGGKIKSRPASVATALAAGLDDWAMQRLKARPKDAAGWRRLVTAAHIADPDPWRDTLRGRFGARDEAAATAFRAMADDPKALEGQPAASLLLLASQLRLGIGDRVRAEKVLRTAWRLSPGDFLVNYELAKAQGRHGMTRGLSWRISTRARSRPCDSSRPRWLFGPAATGPATALPAPWPPRATCQELLRCSANGSGSSPMMPEPIATSACCCSTKEGSARRSPSFTRRSGSSPTMPGPTVGLARYCVTKGSSMRRSPR